MILTKLTIFLLITSLLTGEKHMTKHIGQEFDVNISIVDATEIIGVNTYITYDPNILEYISSTNGTFIEGGVLMAGLLKDVDEVEIPGTIVAGLVAFPATINSGDGDLFSVKFKALATGTTEVAFDVNETSLQTESSDIPVSLINDSVEVPILATMTITVI